MSFDIDARGQEHGNIILGTFVSQGFSHFVRHIHIPGRSKAAQVWKRGMILIRIPPDAMGAIRHFCCRDPQSFDRHCAHTLRAGQQTCLFLQGHFLDKLNNRVVLLHIPYKFLSLRSPDVFPCSRRCQADDRQTKTILTAKTALRWCSAKQRQRAPSCSETA